MNIQNSHSEKTLRKYSYKKPNIVIVGDSSLKDKFEGIEKKYNLDLIFTDLRGLPGAVQGETVAIILDEMKVSNNFEKTINNFVKNFGLFPLYYLSRTKKEESFFISLYSRGFRGVFAWPREQDQLVDLIIETMKAKKSVLGKTTADKKLGTMINAHLKLLGHYGKVKIKIIDGFVFLKGKVKNIFQKEKLEIETSRIPGVKKIISKNITVENDLINSKTELERKINFYISKKFGDLKKTISVKVENRTATLLGQAKSQKEMLKIADFTKKQTGIDKVICEVSFAPKKVKATVNRAKVFEAKVKRLFEGAKFISISLLGDKVEVSGTVKHKADRKLIESFLLQMLPVKTVTNKLYVSDAK